MSNPGTFTFASANLAAAQDRLVRETEAIVRAGDVPRAIEMARAGLARGMSHPLLLNLRAYWLEQQNRDKEALQDLKRAAALAPNDPLIRNSYGLTLAKSDLWPEAMAEFEAAVRLQPDFTPAHYSLGCARERIGDLGGAREAFEYARKLDPANMELPARLAALAARGADWENAKSLATEALQGDPKESLARVTLANVAVEQRELDTAESLLSEILFEKDFPDFYRAMAFSLLGDLRHVQKRFDEAFEAYAKGNAERRRMFAPRYAVPGLETPASYAIWLSEYFEQAPQSNWSVRGKAVPRNVPPKEHIFLIGFPRSGTTLLENVLSSNPAVVALEEKEVLADSVRAFFTNEDGRDRLGVASDETLDEFRGRYWHQVAEYCNPSGKVFIDKQPLSSMKLPVIAKLFPNAKILFAIRDPRDVVLSCFRRQFTLNPAMFEFLDVKGAAQFYAAVMRLSAIYRQLFQQPWHEVKYERLVETFDAEASAACDFIGLQWTDEMRSFAEKARQRIISTPSANQVRRGLNRDGLAQWRHYKKGLGPALPVLQPWVETFGYPAD
jgi:Flp pilus assembly protein TadD